METLVIIPTYNERENIEPLLERLLALPYGLEVLVVDDNSPDGTGGLVDERGRGRARASTCSHRPGKMGLGLGLPAPASAGRWTHGYEYIFEMDADFSHDPESIAEFLEAAEDADLVLGSRYLTASRSSTGRSRG